MNQALYINGVFEEVLEDGWEGLILVSKKHLYKFGRSTLKSGTIYKLKNDSEEYDGVILDVVEAGYGSSDSNNDGRVDDGNGNVPAVNADGLVPLIDPAITGVGIPLPIDWDNDGVFDILCFHQAQNFSSEIFVTI